jgi:hypothetical protein
MAKVKTSTMATMNAGTAAPTMETTCTTRSVAPPLTAATTPRSTLKMAVRRRVRMTTVRVSGTRFANAPVTDSAV